MSGSPDYVSPTSPHTTAAILSVGDELTLGQTLDTNSQWLSRELADRGVLPVLHATVPDDLGAMVDVLRRACEQSSLVIITGGLGPTLDDLTRNALCQVASDTLVTDEPAVEELKRWFAARGRVLLEANLVQAQRPSRGRCLSNPNGTAPGLFTTVTTRTGKVCDVFALPGPPGEMKPMFEREVVPSLRREPGTVLFTRAMPCVGIGESELARRLGPLMDRSARVLVGTTASKGVVTVRIRFQGKATLDEAKALVDATVAKVRELAGVHVVNDTGDSLEQHVLSMLTTSGRTLTAAESCTGGLLGATLTAIPGSSSAFLGGWVTYANAMKVQLLGVDPETLRAHGAVSREVAKQMALGALARSGAHHAVSITGIAGPDGGTPTKPVGTVYIAHAWLSARQPGSGSSPDPRTDIRRFRFTGGRQDIRERACTSALAMLHLQTVGDQAREANLLWQVADDAAVG